MNSPFNPFGDPFAGPPAGGFGFGFAPQSRRDLHEARRQTKRELLEHLRDHGVGPDSPFGFGPMPRGGRRRSHRRHGVQRGDVRAAILTLLIERPMHGYEMIRQIADRSQNVWRPSPGSVYPTLQLLVDEGLLTSDGRDGSKKLFELTEEGRAAAEKIETPPWETIAADVDPGQAGLRTAIGQLYGAVAQAAEVASAEQQQRIIAAVNATRREVYGILGEE